MTPTPNPSPEVMAAAERTSRLRAGKEKSQDIYGIQVVDTPLGISEACRTVKRLMLNDERTLIDYALSLLAARSDDSLPITEEWIREMGLEFSEGNEDYSPEPDLTYGDLGNTIGVIQWGGKWQVVVQSEGGNDRISLRNCETRGQIRDLLAALGATTASPDAERGE